MKVTYIKTKDTELDIPEYTEELTRLFGMYLEEGFSIENGNTFNKDRNLNFN